MKQTILAVLRIGSPSRTMLGVIESDFVYEVEDSDVKDVHNTLHEAIDVVFRKILDAKPLDR